MIQCRDVFPQRQEKLVFKVKTSLALNAPTMWINTEYEQNEAHFLVC